MKRFVQLAFFVFVWVSGFGQGLALKLYSAASQRKMCRGNTDFIIYTLENKTNQFQSYSMLLSRLYDSEGYEIGYRTMPSHLPPINRHQDTIAPNTTFYKLIRTNNTRSQYSLEEVTRFSIEYYILREGKDKVVMKPLEFEYNDCKITQAEIELIEKLLSLKIKPDNGSELIRLTFELMPKNDKDQLLYHFRELCFEDYYLTLEQRKESLLRFLPYFDDEHDANVIAFIAARDYQKEDRQNSTLNNYLKKHKNAFELYKKILKQEHGIVLD